MRVLIVEDKAEYAMQVQKAIQDRCNKVDVSIASSRDSAKAAIDDRWFDLLICDLRIPTADSGLDEDPTHGWAVIAHCRDVLPGTPTCVLTGTRSDDQPSRVVEFADKQDVFGTGTPESVLHFYRKDQLTECLDYVEKVSNEQGTLCGIEITQPPSGPKLDRWERRVIQIFCRRRKANMARTQALSGFSDSKVLSITTQDSEGREARVVARIAGRPEICEEHDGYQKCLTGVLPNQAYVTHADNVLCGAGGFAGAFYELANGFDRSLFDVLKNDEAEAVQVLRDLRKDLADWPKCKRNQSLTVADIRRVSLSEESLGKRDLQARLTVEGKTIPIESLERRQLLAHWCRGHRDLHGANILVSQDLAPVLIDFGDLGEGTAALDPIVLELSLLFHPNGRGICGSWPTVENARSWSDLDAYLEGCPIPVFIRACRAWANDVAAGEREVLATGYAHALRQLKYPDTPHEIARAMVSCALEAIEATY